MLLILSIFTQKESLELFNNADLRPLVFPINPYKTRKKCFETTDILAQKKKC